MKKMFSFIGKKFFLMAGVNLITPAYMNLMKAYKILAKLGNYQATIELAMTTLLILKFLMVQK